MFTAENWRTFLRLRLVPPICSMTQFYTNFLLYREPNIALLLGAPIGSFHFFTLVQFRFSPLDNPISIHVSHLTLSSLTTSESLQSSHILAS